jgi:endonuclease YncB( thermonuclease family)
VAYRYEHVEVIRVIDGDTVELRIDLGNRCWWQEHFRLYGIDTPEMHGETKQAGEAAGDRLRELLANGVTVAETLRPDKFGRTLIRLTVILNGWPVYVAPLMISEGHGVAYFGGKK